MKKFYVLILVGLCSAGSCWADCPGLGTKTGYEYFGQCAVSNTMGYELYFTIDGNYTLAFWHNQDCTGDDPEIDYTAEKYQMPDYANPDTYAELQQGCLAPWADDRVENPIRVLDLTHLTNIGQYAFCGLTGVNQVTIPATVTEIGEYAFWSSTNLTTLKMLATVPPRISFSSLQLDGDNKQITTIIVPNEEAKSLYMRSEMWNSNGRTFEVAEPETIQATGATFTDCTTTTYQLEANENVCEYDMLVGQRIKLSYTLEPADADPNSIEIGQELIEGMPLIFDSEGNVEAMGFGRNYVYIIPKGGTKENCLAKAIVFATYVDNGALYDLETESGQVYYSVDADYRLQFWAERLNEPKQAGSTTAYNIPNYDDANPAPWHSEYDVEEEEWRPIWYRDYITEVVLNNIDSVGNNAFHDLPNLKYVLVPENIKSLGDHVFLGCTNLKTIEVERYNQTQAPEITSTTGRSLITDNTPDIPVRPSIVLVSDKDALATYRSREKGGEWSECNVLPKNGTINDNPNAAYFNVSPSDSLNALKLTIEHNPYTDQVSTIPDRESDESSPLDAYGEEVEDLEITGKISYIGKNAFMSLTNIKTIQFNQRDHPLDSIHAKAFPEELRRGVFPRKFSFGDPQDGPIVPPSLILGDDMSEVDATLRWRRLFSDSTGLFVPDSMFEYMGELVRAIDLYTESNFWGNAFFRINDRTVDTTASDTSVVLTWIPLENAEGYYLTVHEVGCTTDRCDTTIFIPADGMLGLLDWARINAEHLIPQYIAARRAPMDEGGGGLVLTISIESGSGSDHTSDVTVNVAGKKNQDYTFTREVVQKGKIASAYTKGGSFHVADQSTSIGEINTEDPTNDKIVNDKIVNIYDLLGRPLGTSLEALSDGIYIIDNGTKRTTILLRR